MKKLKSLVKTLIFNAAILFLAYQFLILNNENWGNVFKILSYIWCPLIFIIGSSISKVPNLDKYKKEYSDNKVFPFWIWVIPDLAIFVACAYFGYWFLSVLWFLYVLGQTWISSEFSKPSNKTEIQK